MFGLGSSAQLGIGIAVRLQDQFSGTAKRINQELLAMRKNSYAAVTQAMRDYRNNAMGVATMAGMATAGMFKMVQKASEYDHLLNQIMILGGKGLGKSRRELDSFAQSMTTLFPEKPRDVANIMVENVRAGVSSGLDIITKYQMAVATATNEAISGEQGVARGLLGIMNAMGMTIDQFPRIANAVSIAANESMASVYSINEAMQYFANTAGTLGMTLEQTLAMVAKLSQANIPGSSMGTALNNMVSYAVKSVGQFQTPKNKQAWKALGIDSDQIVGLINNAQWFELFEVVDRATKGMDLQPKQALIRQLFGVRGQRALVNMFGSDKPGIRSVTDYYQSIMGGRSNDVVMQQAKAMSDDPWADIKFIGNALARFGINFLNAARPTLRVFMGIVTKVIEFANVLLSTGIGKVLAGIAVIAAPLVGILFAFRAAALTATIALRGFAVSSRIGGFSSLLQAGLGLVGMGRFGQYGGKFIRDKAGKFRVAAGESITHGGKTFTGGQYVPNAFLASIGIGAKTGTTAASAMAGKSFMSKVLTWGGKALGMFGRFLPIVGLVWTGVELLKGLFNISSRQAQKPQLDPVFINYYKHLDEQLYGISQSNDFYNREGMSYGEWFNRRKEAPVLNQQLNINLDGVPMMNKMIQFQTEQSLNNSFDFEMPGY